MTDDMRLLLRILLEQELREAEPEMQRQRKKREAEREDGIDYAPAESRGKTKRTKDTMKEERAEDLQQARSDMYSTHEKEQYTMANPYIRGRQYENNGSVLHQIFEDPWVFCHQ